MVRVALGLSLSLCGVLQAADDFNQQRLEEGRIAYQRKSYLVAEDHFRVAAFGFLDSPERVSECLARLSLAQAGAGQMADVTATLNRFLDIERRFTVFAKANLEPEIRADFQALLLRTIPVATVTAVPSLASLVETEEQKLSRLPSADRRKALKAAAKREPNAPKWPLALAREAMERGDNGEARGWVDKALALDPANVDAKTLQASLERPPAPPPSPARAQRGSASEGNPAPAPPPTAGPARASAGKAPAPEQRPAAQPVDTQQVLRESRRLILASRSGEAVTLLNNAVSADSGNRELRLALLEAACLSRAYPLAVAQLPVSAPFSDGEASSMFYAAVALFETGRQADARNFLQRALPRVSGPLVDEYSKKIMAGVQ
jgi:tetratricopeptide (TPR) repeat protein